LCSSSTRARTREASPEIRAGLHGKRRRVCSICQEISIEYPKAMRGTHDGIIAVDATMARNLIHLRRRLDARHDQGLEGDRAAVGAGVLVALFVPPLVFAPVPQP
jgi:hypothetical protein